VLSAINNPASKLAEINVVASGTVPELWFDNHDWILKPLKVWLPGRRAGTSRKVNEKPVPVLELALHSQNYGTVAVARLRIRFLLDLDDEDVFVVVPALMNDHVGKDSLFASAAAGCGKIDLLFLKAVPIVFDINLVDRKVRH
jgi:hypothetical protein